MNDYAGIDSPQPGDTGHDIDQWDTELEPRGRHRLGEPHTCRTCRTVADDDQLVEDLRADTQPPTSSQIGRLLAAWRNAARR